MMTRREFGKYLALLAAGASALPAQLQAFETLYETNLPQKTTGLIHVSDLTFGFRNPRDSAVLVAWKFGPNRELPFVVNYRTFTRYVTTPDLPILSTVEDFAWGIYEGGFLDAPSDESWQVQHDFMGSIAFTDQEGKIHQFGIDGQRRTLKEYL
jgi:hypothetical protein